VKISKREDGEGVGESGRKWGVEFVIVRVKIKKMQ